MDISWHFSTFCLQHPNLAYVGKIDGLPSFCLLKLKFGCIPSFQTRRWISLNHIKSARYPIYIPMKLYPIASPWLLRKCAKSELNPSKSDQIHEKSPASPFFLGPGLSLFPGLQGASQHGMMGPVEIAHFGGFKLLSQNIWWFNQRSCALNITVLQECGGLTSFQQT